MRLVAHKLSAYLQTQIERGAFPSAQYAIGESGTIMAEDALGQAVVEPERIAATTDTIYDLASLTKPLVTTLVATIFAARGLLDLDAPLAAYLSEFDAQKANHKFTLKQLLTHTSGLPAWAALYNRVTARDGVVSAIARLADEAGSGETEPPVVYSDLNFILLGFLLERLSGQRFDALAQREIFEPLALKRTMFNPPRQRIREVASTEHGRLHERATVESQLSNERERLAEADALSERQRIPSPLHPFTPSPLHHFTTSPSLPESHHPFTPSQTWGEVHDGNAYFLDGVAGHAGLFSTAREVFWLANQFLPASRLLKPEWLTLFTTNFTRGRGDARSIGWLLAATPDCSAAATFAPTAFGHTGFTGTSVWIDPTRARAFVLLTNRVHPKIGSIDMKPIRREFNTLANR